MVTLGALTVAERAPRDLLPLILDAVAEGITVQDAAGRLVYANDAAAHLSGYPNAEAMLSASTGEILSHLEVLAEDGQPFPPDRLPGRLALSGERAAEGRSWLRKPWPMFLLGCLVATLTLSVSVALTVLIPLASKGYIRRREAIPYIMGANITTLADTLVAAMLLGNPVAVQIVLAEAIGVSLVTLFYLAFLYRPIANGVMALDEWVVHDNVRLSVFVAVLFVLPAVFATSGWWIGLFSG
jgi:PAS domain-containing protein